MNKNARAQVEQLVTPMLSQGEELQRVVPAWAVEDRAGAPLLFRARDLHFLALTDQRLVLLERPRRRRPLAVTNLVLAKRYSTFTPERVRRVRPMAQVKLKTAGERVLVLEFRPRDRSAARALADALGVPSGKDRKAMKVDKPAKPGSRRAKRRDQRDQEASAAQDDLRDLMRE